MKLNTASENSIISFSDENSSESSFQIDMNAKAFRTLSDSLYMNKIGSIVREISCNALDSHIAAGKPEAPFEIHLPNTFEPWFAVKDFGIGLSQDDIEGVERVVENFRYEENEDGSFKRISDGTVTRKRDGGIYTTLFKSTKDQSNAMIGAFGLGSKTPFAYTDSFVVTSIKDGVKYHYSAYINERGIPSVLLLQKEDTTEPNGVEVKISVKREHYHTFEDEVCEQLRFFNVKPVITNGSVSFNNSLNSGSPLLLDTKNVRVRDFKKDNYESDVIHAVLGVVGYPINLENLGSKYTRKVSDLIANLQGRVAFIFEIGELEVTASREGISYTDKSINAIIRKFETAKTELLEKFKAELNCTDGTTAWDKAATANKYGKLTALFLSAGYDIPGTSAHNDMYGFDMWTAQVSDSSHARNYSLNTYKETDKGSLRRDARDVRHVVPDAEIKIFIRDTDKKPIARLREFAEANSEYTIYVIDRSGMRPEPEFSDSEVAEFRRTLGGVEITRISTLPEPARKARAGSSYGGGGGERAPYSIPTAYMLNPSHYEEASGRRLDNPFGMKVFEDFEDITPSYYLGSERGIVISQNTYSVGPCAYTELQMLKKIRIVFNKMKRQMPDIYVFNAKKIGKVAESIEWKPVSEFITTTLAEFQNMGIKIAKFRASRKARLIVTNWLNSSYLNMLTNKATIKLLDKTSAGAYPIRLYRVLSRRSKASDVYDMLLNQFGGFYDESQVDAENATLESGVAVARARMPLLEHIATHYRYNVEQLRMHVIQYINVMGKIEPIVEPKEEEKVEEVDSDEPVEVEIED